MRQLPLGDVVERRARHRLDVLDVLAGLRRVRRAGPLPVGLRRVDVGRGRRDRAAVDGEVRRGGRDGHRLLVGERSSAVRKLRALSTMRRRGRELGALGGRAVEVRRRAGELGVRLLVVDLVVDLLGDHRAGSASRAATWVLRDESPTRMT